MQRAVEQPSRERGGSEQFERAEVGESEYEVGVGQVGMIKVVFEDEVAESATLVGEEVPKDGRGRRAEVGKLERGQVGGRDNGGGDRAVLVAQSPNGTDEDEAFQGCEGVPV